jgi:hypothetical protein
VEVPLALFWTTSGGATSELQYMSSAAASLRVCVLLFAWIYIFPRLEDHPRLYKQKTCLVLLVIALGSTVVHLLCFMQQVLLGRWWFEEMDVQHSLWAQRNGDKTISKSSKVVDEPNIEEGCTAVAPESREGSTKVKPSLKQTGGLYDTAGASSLFVAERWHQVHELLPDATARVPRHAFVDVHKKHATKFALSNASSHDDFLNDLFDAAIGLMYPKKKDDLGKHCFGYASLLDAEYYGPGNPPDRLGLLTVPAIGWFDPLKVLRVQLQDDWNQVKKDSESRVGFASFKETLLRRHVVRLGGISAAVESFELFLEKLFKAVCRLPGHSNHEWVDHHGFIYGAFFAYEFYFADARDAKRSEGCGSSTPVADNLGITVPLPPKRH